MENILIFLAVTVIVAFAVALFTLRKSTKRKDTKDYQSTPNHPKVG